MGLPMDDDYLYETFKVAKPANYDQLKAEKAAQRLALQQQLQGTKDDDDDSDEHKKRLNTVQTLIKRPSKTV